ncbi:MAG: AAC(3) family N-acetyltransferase [Candidatus Staskawiczbacteria bacterium]|jgi:aminoglycoside 3-N-acetyltransferase
MVLSWENKIIFKTEEKDFKFKDIVDVLKKAGIKRGDVLMIHADLGRFGKLGKITNKDEFADIFIEAFRQVVGEEGTLIVPTFTYSFCNNEVYDPDNTPSKVGLFTEHLRKKEGAFRSIHPIFSVAAIGKRSKELTTNLSKSSFGKSSIYDKLRGIKNSKYVIFGVDYFASTQIHYIEEKLKVPYRYVKKFKGKIRKRNKVYSDEYEYFVRRLDEETVPDFSKIEKHLFSAGFLKKVPLGNAFVGVVKISDICRESTVMFRKDPKSFLKNTKNA